MLFSLVASIVLHSSDGILGNDSHSIFSQSRTGAGVVAFSTSGRAFFGQCQKGNAVVALAGSGSGVTAFGGPIGVWGRGTQEDGRGV
ncbi:MAG: hypothetical protein ACR2JB_03925 [Bryobacteraceae bacterium]